VLYDFVKGFQSKTHHDLISVYKFKIKNPIEEAPIKINGKNYRIDLFDPDTNTSYEIQRNNFGKSFYLKIEDLCLRSKVVVVHPIAHKVKITKLSGGNISGKPYNYLPKKDVLYSFFQKLVSFKSPFLPGKMQFDLLLIREHIWKDMDSNPRKSRGRKKGVIRERSLLGIDKIIKLVSTDDFLSFLPRDLSGTFTNQDIAIRLNIKGNFKQKLRITGCITYCLCNLGILKKKGKRGRANLFTLND
jgi:hypothetical protein